MAQRVEVPGVGIVEFPDGMSRDDMAAALSQIPAPKVEAKPTPAAKKEATIRGVDELPLVGRELPSDMQDFGPRPIKSTLGVMEDAAPLPPEKGAFLPIRPELRRALTNAYDAGTPKERDKLLTIPGAKGDVIREYAQKFEAQQDKRRAEFERQQRTGVVLPDFFESQERFGRSAEARAARLVAEGEKPEFAEVAARRAAAAGVLPGGEVKFIQQEGIAEKTDFDFDIYNEYKNANPVVRGAMAGWQGYKQGALGLNQALAELVGADELAKAVGTDAKKSKNVVKSMGENPVYAARMFEGAIGSIAQQIPALIVGTATGSSPLVLGSMFAQAFGQEYAEGRQRGLDGADAAQRAGLFASFEIIGERFGLKFQLDNLRRATRGMKTDELKDFLGNTLKKELPGEYLTTTGQFIVDKSNIGLNKDASLSDYLQQMTDTTVQTLMQSGLMTAGTKGVGRGVSFVRGDRETRDAFEADYRDLMREKGFMGGEQRPELKELQAARKPELETEAPPDRTLSALEKARNEGIEVEAPEGPTLSAMERARKPEIEGEAVTPPREAMIQARAVEYERQGYMEDDARLLAEREIDAEARSEVAGRAVQRQDTEDERRTAEGRAERAVMSMEAPSELPEPPSYVTQPSTDEYGAAVPSGADRTARGPVSAFDRGLATARGTAGELDARERAERASLDANQRRIESDISQAFSREALPDLGSILGASWTRNTLAKNPSPEDYQEAAYARLEELGGQRPSDATPAFERAKTTEKPSVAKAPEAVEAKEERQAAPAAAKIAPLPEAKPGEAAMPIQGGPVAAVPMSLFTTPDALRRAGEVLSVPTKTPERILRDLSIAAQRGGLAEWEVRKIVGEEALRAAQTPKATETAPAPLELEAGRREDLEVEPPEIAEVKQAEQALTKAGTPRQRAPGAGPKVKETSKTQAEKTAQSKALGKFNRDTAVLIAKAKEFSERQSIETFQTPDEFEYKEALRDMYADQMRAIIYGLAQRTGSMAQGYIDAKDYIRSLPEALRNRAKALHEGTAKLSDYHEIPPKPAALIERERKSEAYKKARAEGKAKKEALSKPQAARRKKQEDLGLSEEDIYRIEQQLDMNPDPTFKELTTLTGALVYISESPNQLEAELAARLLQNDNIESVAETTFQVVETDTTDVDPRAKELLDDDALGAYIPYTQGGTVFVRGESYGEDQGINAEIVLHEGMHAIGAKKIAFVELAEKNDAPVPARLAEAVHQLRDLMDRTRETYARLLAAGTAPSSLERLAEAGAFTDIQEFYAYGMTDPSMKLFLRDSVPGTSNKTSGFDRFVDILMRLFGVDPKLKSGLKDLLLVSNEIMSTKKPSDKVLAELASKENADIVLKAKKQRDETARVMRNLKAAKTAEEVVEQLGSLTTVAKNPELWGKWLKRNYTNMSIPALKGYLYSMPTNVIIDIGTSAGIGSLKELDRDSRNMTTFQHGRMREVENTVKEWSKIKAPMQKKLSEVMNTATDLQVDPDKNTSNKELNKMWAELTPEAKAVYRKARDFFKTSYSLYTGYLEQRIKNSGLKDEDKANIMASIRAMHEAGAQMEPYFPLMRHGDYWARFGKGDNGEFQMFDTPGDRDAYVEAKAGGKAAFEQMAQAGTAEKGNNIDALRERVAQQGGEISKIFDAIDTLGSGSATQKSQLKDEIFQLHLLTLPEGSFRKQFIRRKGKAGYGGDALRNFAVAGSRMAGQLGKVKYGPIMNNRLEAARASLAGNPKKDRLDMFVDELNERVKDQITPRHSEGWWPSLVRAANRYAFVYALTTAKSAINNLFSLPINTVPTLMKYFGIKDTIATLGKFMLTLPAQVGVTRIDAAGNSVYGAPSFGSSYMVRRDPELRRAVKTMEDMGITFSTQTYDLWLAKQGKVSTSRTKQFTEGVVRVSGALFQGSERIIREIAFLSAFKLARKTMDYDDAIMKAVDVVNESLYDYSAWNTPRILRSDTAKLLTQFKKYALYTTIYYARNFMQMVAPLKGETRRGAAYAFFGSMGLTGLASGVTGMFGVGFTMQMYGVLQGAWNFVFGGDDDEKTRKEMKELDFVRWFNNVYLPEEFGDIKVAGMELSELLASGVINTATGYDFASGVSAGNLWFRDFPDSGQWEHALGNFVDYMSGPFINITGTMAKGVKDISEGDTLKGLEKLMPIGALRGPMSSYRLSEEGLLDRDLNVIKRADSFTTGMLVMQGMGFKTTGVAEVTDMNFYITKAERQIEDTRSKLIQRWVKADRRKDKERQRSVDAEIKKFNRMFPIEDLEIEAEDLDNALDAKLEKELDTHKGLFLQEKFENFEKLRRRGLDTLREQE